MQYRKPEYYDTFRCAAGQCPDTCCAGWQIAIDEDSLEKYGALKGTFRNRLVNGIDWMEGCFFQYKGKCSLLNDEKLCDLVIECGEDFLCETCAQYPRHVEEFKGVREWTLSLSCPVAAQMILEQEKKVRILEETDDSEDPFLEEFEEFDDELMNWLETARAELLKRAQDRTKPVEERMASILELAQKMQDERDAGGCGDVFHAENSKAEQEWEQQRERSQGHELVCRVEKRKEQENDVPEIEVWEQARFTQLQHQFAIFDKLMCLRDEWQQITESAAKELFRDYGTYSRIRKEFQKAYASGTEQYAVWENMRENLLVFFLFTYFCGAVYDDCVYSKAALSVFSVIFVSEFVMCRWYLADNYIDKQEFVNMAYRYAREIEHSDYNLDTLEEWLMENPINL